MKGKLTFDLNDPDERRAHFRCVKSLDMAHALWEIATNARKSCYRMAEAREMSGQEEGDQIDLVFTKIYEILEENSINVDDLLI